MSPLPPGPPRTAAGRPVAGPARGAVPGGTGAARSGDGATLELELRQLVGVVCVTLNDRAGSTLVELAVDSLIDQERVRSEARRISLGYVDGPVMVDVIAGDTVAGPHPRQRVRLLVDPRPGGDDTVGLLLHYQEQQVTILCEGSREPVADGLLDGLRRLGFEVPYEVIEAHALPEALGAGTLVLICETPTGALRRGVATGRNEAESTARAVLNALNRVLLRAPGDRVAG